MITSIFTSIIAYISTNIDDIFVIMILLAQSVKGAKGRLIAGHFFGVAILTAISMLGVLGLQNLPLRYVGILGFVPIGLGIKAWLDNKDCTADDDASEAQRVGFLSMAMITLGNGADNVGVYIPLFTGFSGSERIGAVVVFTIMTALWVFLANALAEFPKIKAIIEKYKNIAIPVVFIALGLFIILDSGFI
jgi:cadmium resistance transport/sequestration family protein